MLTLGDLSDEKKILLHMQQGSAIKGSIRENLNELGIKLALQFIVDDYFEETMDTLDSISKLCVLADDESVPHECNQNIIFTSGTELL